jgi:predicted dehydrogenase
MRKMRFFQENLYISADLRSKTVEAYSKEEKLDLSMLAGDPTAFIKPLEIGVDDTEPLKKEIDSFLSAVSGETSPAVTGAQALEALKIAEMVLDSVRKGRSKG